MSKLCVRCYEPLTGPRCEKCQQPARRRKCPSEQRHSDLRHMAFIARKRAERAARRAQKTAQQQEQV